ncbi:MAG: hypothetical protein ACR2JH_04980, partial [Solirubrobacteraceae bacterium]
MTVKPPAAPPLPDELEALLRRLRLPYVRKAAAEVIATANAQRWQHAEVLRVLWAWTSEVAPVWTWEFQRTSQRMDSRILSLVSGSAVSTGLTGPLSSAS